MGNGILIIGESGSGKTASLRNFKANEVGIFNCSGKPLPFKNKLPTANTTDYRIIKEHLRANNRNCYILDDIGLTMAFYLFDKVNEQGYSKFTNVAKNFYDLVQCALRETNENTNVYFIMHE
jgi:ABC-type phosphate/phosphonate transport system ATPase subunit